MEDVGLHFHDQSAGLLQYFLLTHLKADLVDLLLLVLVVRLHFGILIVINAFLNNLLSHLVLLYLIKQFFQFIVINLIFSNFYFIF